MGLSEIGLLPKTLIAYTLSSDRNSYAIVASLGLSDNSDLVSGLDGCNRSMSENGIYPETWCVNSCLSLGYIPQTILTKRMAPVASKS